MSAFDDLMKEASEEEELDSLFASIIKKEYDHTYWVNVKLLNAITDNTPNRVVGYAREGKLVGFLHGAEKFTFDPKTGKIEVFPPYKYNPNVEADKIDPDLCYALLHQQTQKEEAKNKKIDKFAQDREELHIKTRIGEKLEKIIKNYRDAFKQTNTNK